MPNSAYAPLDATLTNLSAFGSATTNGNFNHAAMVAEALCALERPDSVMPWIERYRPRLVPRAAAGTPIDPIEWRATLGKRDSFAAWSLFYQEELRAAGWREVLDRWA